MVELHRETHRNGVITDRMTAAVLAVIQSCGFIESWLLQTRFETKRAVEGVFTKLNVVAYGKRYDGGLFPIVMLTNV